MARYVKKPIEIEAFQTDKELIIHTLEGDMKANVGDYIITYKATDKLLSLTDCDEEFVKAYTGYDHNFILNGQSPACAAYSEKSGILMTVETTEPGVQVYTSNWHSGFAGAHGATFPKRSAICFEAQHFPASPNRAHFPSVVLCPGETYKQVTVYKFGVEK